MKKKGVIYSVKGKGNFVSPKLDAVRREKENELVLKVGELLKKAKAIGLPRERFELELEKVYHKEREDARLD